MPIRDRVVPGVSKRTDFTLVPSKSALLIIDVQKYLSEPDDEEERAYYCGEAFPRMIRNLRQLTDAFRSIRDKDCHSTTKMTTTATTATATGMTSPSANSGSGAGGCEVIFTYLQSLTNDGRDISLDYKLSGPLLTNIPNVYTSREDLFLSECYPRIGGRDKDDGRGGSGSGTADRNNRSTATRGDLLIPKTSCSVFVSTNLDYVLRNLGIEQIVVTGQLTDQCVESAVRDGADLGYFVTVVEDACSAHAQSSHSKGLAGMKGFCRIASTQQIIRELQEYGNGTDLASASAAANRDNIGKAAAAISDESVLEYLKSRGLEDVAETVRQRTEQR